MEALHARVDEVLSNTTAPATKYAYMLALAQSGAWLYNETPNHERNSKFTSDFLAFVGDAEVDKTVFRRWQSQVPLRSPYCAQKRTTCLLTRSSLSAVI